MNNKYIHWILRIIPAAILLQTLYFKFGSHPDSIDLFTQLGAEPYGRYSTGVLELVATICLLIPKLTKYGALLSVGLMTGAIGSHLFVIGISHAGDGGALFGMALVVMICSIVLIYIAWLNQIKNAPGR